MIRHILVEDTDGIRIDRYLSEYYTDFSRSYLQKLLKDGGVLVDGKIVKSNYKVSSGERILMEIPEAVEPKILPEEIALDILYEDADIILVNKPKGMVVHPAAGHDSGECSFGTLRGSFRNQRSASARYCPPYRP